ncbi:MAG: hypothetical protein LBR85_00645 [Oscillospiraceae bacterium]|nr:hypothetical protein [Oscillospiraceae bacterium]
MNIHAGTQLAPRALPPRPEAPRFAPPPKTRKQEKPPDTLRPDNNAKPKGLCQTCASRKYKDQSGDAGVSFKGGAKAAPSIAASLVHAHEKEHVAIAEQKGRETGANVQTKVRLHAGICPECKKVYISGGTTEVTISKPSSAEQDGQGKGGIFDAAI